MERWLSGCVAVWLWCFTKVALLGMERWLCGCVAGCVGCFTKVCYWGMGRWLCGCVEHSEREVGGVRSKLIGEWRFEKVIARVQGALGEWKGDWHHERLL